MTAAGLLWKPEFVLSPADRPGKSRPIGALAWQWMAGTDASAASTVEPLMRIDEVAQVLRISERGVYRLMGRGELASLKVGGRTLLEPAEVRRFIAVRRSDDGREVA